MALLKFLKGLSTNLNSQPVIDGQCYITTDTGKMYVDINSTNRIGLNAFQADNANKLNVDAGTSTRPVYFSGGIPVQGAHTILKDVPADAKFTDTWRPLGNTADTAAPGNHAHNYSPTGHSHKELLGWPDTRNEKTTPNDYNGKLKVVGIKSIAASGLNDGNYSTLMGIRGWTDSSGGVAHEIAFGGNGNLFFRSGSDTTWSGWRTIIDSGIIQNYAAPVSHSHSYLPLGGGTLNDGAQIKRSGASVSWIHGHQSAIVCENTNNGYHTVTAQKTRNGWWSMGTYDSDYVLDRLLFSFCLDTDINANNNRTNGQVSITKEGALYGAVWNDYAEYRLQKESVSPGYCVASADNGAVYKTTEKFQACDGIVSDTFGFAIGETDECKTPLAVAGRVLAYCAGDRNSYHAGDTVCAGPDGKVMKMTREEIKEYPDRIIGIVSEIPEYETWGTGNVSVDGRIWIKVK